MEGEGRTHIKIELGTTSVERFTLGWVWGDRRDVEGGISKTKDIWKATWKPTTLQANLKM